MKIIDPLSTTNQSRDIVAVLHGMAGQEGNDGEPWDQLQQAAEYITFLRAKLKRLKKKAAKQRMTNQDAVKLANLFKKAESASRPLPE